VGHYLASRRALVLLDNCEHVVESASEVAASLLESARNVKILATCREPLGVGGEVTWAVPSLVEADAVDLFTDRARRALPQFKLRDDDRPAVLAICRRLDCLPLANAMHLCRWLSWRRRSSRWVLWKVQRPASRRPPHSPTRES